MLLAVQRKVLTTGSDQSRRAGGEEVGEAGPGIEVPLHLVAEVVDGRDGLLDAPSEEAE